MNKYIHLYKTDKPKKLRNMQNKNPKAYWKYLNSINKTQPNPRAHDRPVLRTF